MINKNAIVMVGVDIVFLLISINVSNALRFDLATPPQFASNTLTIFPVIMLIKISCFYFFDLYRGMWRYTGVTDLVNVLKASTSSSLLVIFMILVVHRFEGFSRSVFIIDWCFTIIFISGIRLAIRLYFELGTEKISLFETLKNLLDQLFGRKNEKDNLLIIGAGDCGEKIYREICTNPLLRYNVVGFIDDDPRKVGRKMHGVPVVNSIDNLKAAALKVNAHEVLIAIPSASSSKMRRIIEACKSSRLKYKIVPNYGEVVNDQVSLGQIRDVAYRDLLGREVIKLDEEKIGGYLKGQVVLVTGAGGSIGSELCRQISRFQPERLVLVERAETPLFEVELELKQNFSEMEIVPMLVDVQAPDQIEDAFRKHKPQTVFHAAAYKHVPMLEMQPWKAVENNIIGTSNMVECAKKYGVDRFVFVSTDKAVRPSSIMGATKRVAEIMVQNQNVSGGSKTMFMIVRFGNVIGSAGSVIPIFKKQIEKGGPVTITHPDVSRYFMMIPEASQLILQAGAMGVGGEIFILDMGTPVRIEDMARDLIRFYGYEPEKDIRIEYIGMRPGEKLYEELVMEDEGIFPTDHNKIMVLRGSEHNLQTLNGSIERLAGVAEKRDGEKIKAVMAKIIPEYKPASYKNGYDL